MDDTIKILIAEDHQLVSEGFRLLLKDISDLEIAGVVENGKEAIAFTKKNPVDVILMDIEMPVLDGLEATKSIKKIFPDVNILVLTMHNEASLVNKMRNAGANGYTLKNVYKEELIMAIRHIHHGKEYFSEDLLSKRKSPSSNKQTAFDNIKHLNSLTPREIQILQLIGEGNSNKKIGEILSISYRTVDTHRTNLMKKLNIDNVAGLIRFAYEHELIS